jgi:Ca2+-binding RTX toxin-like protein
MDCQHRNQARRTAESDMATTFLATDAADTFDNPSHSILIGVRSVSATTPISLNQIFLAPAAADLKEPYNGFVEGLVIGDASEPSDTMLSIIRFVRVVGGYYFEVFADNAVDYSSSTSGVFIDLEASVQHNGFAEGDVLTNMGDIIGSAFDDVIRGSNPSDFPADSTIIIVNDKAIEQPPFFFTLRNPGYNFLSGGDGNDVLEGRGGADTLDGGNDFDFASYESSPTAVTVRLAGVNGDSQTLLARGGDAEGDTFLSIEGLLGSGFDDSLTGNSLSNVLAGGLGNDTLDGRGGVDTADYSNDHFDPGYTADKVVVHLGLNGANGTGVEFDAVIDIHTLTISYTQISTDTLISIEAVTGTRGPDEIVGNEQVNLLDGREGDDVLDGGLGHDVLRGGTGSDTASYQSHNSLAGEVGNISLGMNGADGSGNYFMLVTIGGFTVPVLVESDTLQSIENITGSSLNETLNGNEQNNVLDGGFGNDTLIGNGGSDTASYVSHDTFLVVNDRETRTVSLGLNGADGSYTRAAGALVIETDVLRGIANVIGSNRAETINGNEQDNVMAGRGGNDTINGRAGNDTYDFRRGGQGDDRFFDTSGSDKILIDSFDDILGSEQRGSDLVFTLKTGTFTVVNHFAGNPIETLQAGTRTMILATGSVGGNGSGILSGSNGADTLDGRGGDDFLFGANGPDRLIGGTGDDRLTGGNGVDTFVFGPGFGHDLITDFTHADRIEFDGGVFRDFRAVQSASRQVGRDTVITLDADHSITLQDVTLQSLHASHFDFAAGAASEAAPGATNPTPVPNVPLLASYMASSFIAGSQGHASASATDPTTLAGPNPIIAAAHT